MPAAEERTRLMSLGADVEALWHHPGASAETRKHILRTAIVEIVAKIIGDTIDLVVHWQGGDHTQLTVPKNRAGRHRWTTEGETGELIRALARQQPDAGIAAILNRCGKCTGKGNSWTESRVRSHRSAHGIAVYRDGEMAERGELTLEEAARRLTVSKMTVLRLIGRGAIQARQVCKGAPWAISAAELAGLDAHTALARRPQPENPDQRSFIFQ
jgi:excisionase family DNA binding protein